MNKDMQLYNWVNHILDNCRVKGSWFLLHKSHWKSEEPRRASLESVQARYSMKKATPTNEARNHIQDRRMSEDSKATAGGQKLVSGYRSIKLSDPQIDKIFQVKYNAKEQAHLQRRIFQIDLLQGLFSNCSELLSLWHRPYEEAHRKLTPPVNLSSSMKHRMHFYSVVNELWTTQHISAEVAAWEFESSNTPEHNNNWKTSMDTRLTKNQLQNVTDSTTIKIFRNNSTFWHSSFWIRPRKKAQDSDEKKMNSTSPQGSNILQRLHTSLWQVNVGE